MAAAEPANLAGRPADRYPVPGYVPALVRPVLPWARRHVARVTARYGASQDDLWDEAMTALIRAAVYFREQPASGYQATTYGRPLPAARSLTYYARLAVNRACWRYVIRGQATRVQTIPLEDDDRATALIPSAEDEMIARVAARRAWILHQHTALAAARGDDDTTSCLRAAASAADRVPRRPRRHSSPSSTW
jgi:hypothetical protein